MDIPEEMFNTLSDDCLNDHIRNTQCLKLLNIFLNLKSRRLSDNRGEKVSFPISHIYESEVEDLDLQCKVLKSALLVNVNSDHELQNIIAYLNCEAKQFVNQPVQKCMKIAKILNEIIVCCKSDNIDFFQQDVSDNIQLFLLHSVTQKNCSLKIFVITYILHNYLSLLTHLNKVLFLQEIFDKCKTIQNLDIICTLCNYADIQLLLISEQPSLQFRDEFWAFLGSSISCLDNDNLQKQASFVLAKLVEVYHNNFIVSQFSTFIEISNMPIKDSKKMWQNFFILLDSSKEKQLSIMWPSLKLLKSVKCLHPLWQKCIYKILLNHSQISVMYFVARYILQENLFFADLNKYFLLSLNKTELSRDYIDIYTDLPQFCNNLHQEQFSSFLRDILEIAWVPTAIWSLFVNLFCSKLEQNISLTFFEPIYDHLKRIPHVYIRNGCIRMFVIYFIKSYMWNDNNEYIYKMLLTVKEYSKSFFEEVILNHIDACFLDGILNKLEWVTDNNSSDLRLFELFVQITKIVKHQHGLHIILKGSEKFNDEQFAVIYANLLEYFHKTDVETFIKKKIYSIGQNCVQNFLYTISNLMESHEFNEKFYTNMVNVLTEPNSYSQTTVYVAFYTLTYFFKPCNNIKIIVNNWQNRLFTTNKADENVLILFIKLYFLINENCDMLFLENIFNSQSDVIISKTCEIFSTSKVVENCINNIRFLQMGINLLQNITKNKCFNTIVLSYIKCIFSTNWNYILNDLEALNVVTVFINKLLLLSETYSIIGYHLSRNIRHFSSQYNCDNKCFAILVPVIVELFLQGIVLKKGDRVEYSVCQQLYKKLGHVEDNPNMIKVSTRLCSLECMIQIVSKNVGSADGFAQYLVEKYKIHFNRRYFPDSQIHLQKLRIIQALLTIYPFINTQRQSLINLIMESFCMEIHQPCVKQLMQWLLYSLLKNQNDTLSLVAAKIESSTKTQPSTVVAFILVLLHLTLSKTESFWLSTVEELLPWCMGPHFKLRVYSQAAIKTLHEEARKRSYHNFLGKYSFLEKSVNSVIEASGQAFHDTLKSDKLIFHDFNPDRDYCLQTIYVDIPKLNRVTETEWENMLDYKFSTHEIISTLNKDKTFSNSVTNYCYLYSHLNTRKSAEEISFVDVSDSSHNVQRKITPWKIALEEQEEDRPLGDFILIASLVEKSTNLGGLSRTCEVFRVKQLVVNDLKVIKDKEFKSLSMTSENWVDTLEVKVEDLKQFIIGIREKGYCVIGAEQTSESISLNDYKFKKRTALLLGNEKEGISPDIIPILDACVEIPQFGVVRSLNVHVAGATFIWEYAKQYLVQ